MALAWLRALPSAGGVLEYRRANALTSCLTLEPSSLTADHILPVFLGTATIEALVPDGEVPETPTLATFDAAKTEALLLRETGERQERRHNQVRSQRGHGAHHQRSLASSTRSASYSWISVSCPSFMRSSQTSCCCPRCAAAAAVDFRA